MLMSKENSISILGGGSWATALAKIFCMNGIRVKWWVRDPEQANAIRDLKRNPRYLSAVEFNYPHLSVSTDMAETIKETDFVVMAIPAAFMSAALAALPADAFKNKYLVSAVKGVIPECNLIPGEFFHRVLQVPYPNIAVITGPCHAEEVALEKLSYLTVACEQIPVAENLAAMLRNRFIRANAGNDVFGTEYGAVLKNIYAIGSGIYHGLGYGDNFQAVYVTNAIREMERFVDHVRPSHRDVKESAYLGDLLVTAYSQFSRNRTFGMMIGKGYSVKSAQMEMNMIAEGFYAAKSIHELNQSLDCQIPIIESVYRVLYEKMSPAIEMKILTDSLS